MCGGRCMPLISAHKKNSVSSRMAWFTEWVLGQTKIHKETLSRKTKQQKKESKKERKKERKRGKDKRRRKKKEKNCSLFQLYHTLELKELSGWTGEEGVIYDWEDRNLRGFTGGLTVALDASNLLKAVIRALAEHYSPFSIITAIQGKGFGGRWGWCAVLVM